MAEYLVRWEIDAECDTPEQAARNALRIHRKPDSIATVFDVMDKATGETTRHDLSEGTVSPISRLPLIIASPNAPAGWTHAETSAPDDPTQAPTLREALESVRPFMAYMQAYDRDRMSATELAECDAAVKTMMRALNGGERAPTPEQSSPLAQAALTDRAARIIERLETGRSYSKLTHSATIACIDDALALLRKGG